MKNFISDILANRCVLVPFAFVCTFVLECERAGIEVSGGSFKFENHEIKGQYFYL